MNAKKLIPVLLVALASGPSMFASPVVAADTQGSEISAIEPVVATWSVPQILYAYIESADDFDVEAEEASVESFNDNL